MFRVTSLTSMDDRQLNKWIKRLALILAAGTILFVGFYFLDRWRPATEPIVDRRLSALEQAVRDDPEDIVARGQLADTYVAKGQYEDALTQYNAILETGKADEQAKYGRAGAYMGLEQYDLAAQDYQAVVDIAKDGEMANVDPMLQASYYSLGSIAMKQGKPAEAIPPLEKALAIKRSDADALYLSGRPTSRPARPTRPRPSCARPSRSCRSAGASRTPRSPTATRRPARRRWPSGPAPWPTWPPASPTWPSPGCSRSPTPMPRSTWRSGWACCTRRRATTPRPRSGTEVALAESPDNDAARLGMSRVGGGTDASPLPALPTPGAPAGGND